MSKTEDPWTYAFRTADKQNKCCSRQCCIHRNVNEIQFFFLKYPPWAFLRFWKGLYNPYVIKYDSHKTSLEWFLFVINIEGSQCYTLLGLLVFRIRCWKVQSHKRLSIGRHSITQGGWSREPIGWDLAPKSCWVPGGLCPFLSPRQKVIQNPKCYSCH